MIIVNTDYITGKELEMLGLVKGSTIQTKNIGRDITQGFKTLVGGELGAYTQMMNDEILTVGSDAHIGKDVAAGFNTARELATQRMEAEAAALGADAVVNVRYTTSAIMQGAAEVMAYGTAVKFK